ncbi:hypothetical protein KIV64_gp50 [Mycobacterium phage DroogsArmy]|uniref:Uncharacterized protein n=2 Tax=Timshelvirus TaxID=2948926 RepID=G1DB62_9CAUD|nr:hypothetical protein FDI10_gp50 [Mycobacterium phage Timshel]YP_010061996.1 hypothetical protein KIV64_gp50 [Mycobacterium phage DroogsArmy]AEJ92389.1 hypothetical protein TIMSHEL_44 [Mycobacterium phage Timshel]QKO02438.1 hypothetical protein SEA_DROOGSARMY_42 [Mycobacterium phage DroogsArmy]
MTPLTEKQKLWDWLKAERQWGDKVRQWLKAEGVPEHVLAMRRSGIYVPPPTINRASRRALRRRLKLL